MNPANIVCPKCGGVGECREHRTCTERVQKAKDLTKIQNLVEFIGFEDGLPERSEIELILHFGTERDQEAAQKILHLANKWNLATFEEEFYQEEDTIA